jgi:hypothetical protein
MTQLRLMWISIDSFVMLFRIMPVGMLAFAALISLVGAEARERGHLIPVEQTFDVNGPYATEYARLCEEKLFAGPSWVVRYYSGSNVELGVSITKKHNGEFWVAVKQSKPPLASIVVLAHNMKRNLKWALNTAEFHEAHSEIPETTATAIHRYWISLLSDVRPYERTSPPRVFSNKVMLFAKTTGGRILEGQLPPEADKHRRIYAVEDIVDDLTSVCAKPESTHRTLFERIERRARESADAILKGEER